MAFYRTYRPQIIDHLDNDRIRDVLKQLLSKDIDKLPHAYLFTGTRGTGKTTSARILAKLFVCEKVSKTKGPCGECQSCMAVAQGKHMDVIEIDAASNRGIDEIRLLRDGISLAPVSGSYKIYIIDEVHMLTTEAFNALLKTLEEPPKHAVFILATTDPHKLPKTITSRCMHIAFSEAGHDELTHALERITKNEKMVIEPEALSLIVRQAEGSFRDAVKYLEQLSFKKGKITLDDVQVALSVSSDQSVVDFLLALAQRDTKKSIGLLTSLLQHGVNIKTFTVDVLRNLESQLLESVTVGKAGALSISDIKELIKRFSHAYVEQKYAVIPQLPLELEVVEFCESQKTESDVVEITDTTTIKIKETPKSTVPKTVEQKQKDVEVNSKPDAGGMLTIERLTEFWKDVIEETKPINHSIAGVLRSTRPKEVSHGIVTIEAFYKFHQEKLSELKSKEMLAGLMKKLFGETVKVEVVLGNK